MADGISDLAVGEIIEIKYRVPRTAFDGRTDEPFSDRWIVAEIIHLDADTLPIARLVDGQLTDIRSYMTWRRIARLSEIEASRTEH